MVYIFLLQHFIYVPILMTHIVTFHYVRYNWRLEVTEGSSSKLDFLNVVELAFMLLQSSFLSKRLHIWPFDIRPFGHSSFWSYTLFFQLAFLHTTVLTLTSLYLHVFCQGLHTHIRVHTYKRMATHTYLVTPNLVYM